MIRLNRTTEYALISLRHIDRKARLNACRLTSAREIADCYGFPFEITAKTLLRMKETGLIASSQGVRGGYHLQRPLEEVSLAEFLRLMEGAQSIVACCGDESSCEYMGGCEVKGMMAHLNQRVLDFLSSIRLSEVIEDRSGECTNKLLSILPVGCFESAGDV